VVSRQCGKLSAVAAKECIAANHERACSQFYQLCQDCIEVMFAAGVEDVELQPKSVGRQLSLTRLGLDDNGSLLFGDFCNKICQERTHALQQARYWLAIQPTRRR
jgi:hypothetical protein